MKTVIVTGANSGLGLWISRRLLDLDYRVIMACRNLEKARKAIDSLPEFYQRKAFVIKRLDLADFDSVKKFVDELAGESLYALVCNAGISYEGPFRYTRNGIEETFGTNYLGHFMLCNLLLQKHPIHSVVMVSSELHNPQNKSPFAPAVFRPVQELAWPEADPNSTLARQSQSFYATSKLCMILFAYELDRRLRAMGLPTRINAMNPGLMIKTNLGRTHKSGENLYRQLLDIVFRLIGISDNPENSSKSVVRLIDAVNTSGGYYDKDKPVRSSADSYDEQKARALWEESNALIAEIAPGLWTKSGPPLS